MAAISSQTAKWLSSLHELENYKKVTNELTDYTNATIQQLSISALHQHH